MSKTSGAALMVRALVDENINFVLGIPGTHNIEFYDALVDEPSIQTVLVTDEQCASFMADGMARASGKMAALCLVPGAGLTHALSGIAECFMDKVPLLVIATGIRDDMQRAFQLHDIDQLSVVNSVCKKTFKAKTPADVYNFLRDAAEIANTSPCGPAIVEIPANLIMFTHEFSETSLNARPKPPVYHSQSAPKDIIATLGSAKNIGIYAGWGAQNACPELLALAERLDAVVFTTITGKGVFPEDHPRWAWNVMGRAAPPEIQAIENTFDCLLAIGCRFAEVGTASYGLKTPTHFIHIDIDSNVFNKNFQSTLTWTSDAKSAISSILQDLNINRTCDSLKLEALKSAHKKIRINQESEYQDSTRVSPPALIRALQTKFGVESIFVTDSGNGTFVAMENLRLLRSRSFLAPVDYSCMGYSVPALIGAKLACPTRPAIGLIGDGAFLMTAMELLTAVRYNAGVIAIVLNDGELAQIAQFQKKSLMRAPATKLSEFNYENFAKAIGIHFLAIETNGEIQSKLGQASQYAAKGQPVLIDACIDYSNPTYFTKGAIKTHLNRLDWQQKFRIVSRMIKRKIFN